MLDISHIMLTICREPSCFQEEMHLDDAFEWKKDMESKFDSINYNQIWKLVSLHSDKDGFTKI